jgi:GNAT superfamily N-acetyltransferase
MPTNWSVVSLNLRDAIAVRHAAYYPGLDVPLTKARLDCDGDLETSHFGVFENRTCIAVGSLTNGAPSPRTEHERPFRLRGMAVLPEHQGRRLGAAVLRYAIERVEEVGGGLMWGNIRVAMTGFYEKYGFTMSEDTFFVRDGSPMHHYGELLISSGA